MHMHSVLCNYLDHQPNSSIISAYIMPSVLLIIICCFVCCCTVVVGVKKTRYSFKCFRCVNLATFFLSQEVMEYLGMGGTHIFTSNCDRVCKNQPCSYVGAQTVLCFIVQGYIYYPCTASLLANVNLPGGHFADPVKSQMNDTYRRHQLDGWDLELLPFLVGHFLGLVV